MRPVRKADNLPPSCAVVTKSGNLKFLEPSGPLRACNGTTVPSLCTYMYPMCWDDTGYEIQPSLLLIGWRKRARFSFAGMYLRQVYQLHHPLSP